MFAREQAFFSAARTSTGVLGALLLVIVTGVGQAAPAGQTLRHDTALSYRIDGVLFQRAYPGPALTVQELLDVSLTAQGDGLATTRSPAPQLVLPFVLANAGNGQERFRLFVSDASGDFPLDNAELYLESNGQPGLQLGAGGDTLYVPDAGDPELAPGETLSLYVVADVPDGLAGGVETSLTLWALPETVVLQAGVSQPWSDPLPDAGTLYAGQGDPDESGEPTDAIVGAAFGGSSPAASASFDVLVQGPVLELDKTVHAIADPDGGQAVITGSLVDYRIDARIHGEAPLSNFVLSDDLPPYLALVEDSIVLLHAPDHGEGAQFESFTPSAVDFDADTRQLRVQIGAVDPGHSFRLEYRARID